MLLLFYYETWVFIAKWAILSKIFSCSLNVLLFPIWTRVHIQWNIKADKMVFLCQNLGERIKRQRIIVRTLDSFFRQFSVWKSPLFFLVMVPHLLLVELLTTRSPTDPAGAWIYAPISVKLLTSRALVFILPPSSVPAFGGTDDTQSSTNPAGTKLTCFWRILIQQLFAPGGCSTFDPILAGARSDLQYLELRAQSLLWSWHELFCFSFWAALVFSASFRRIAFQNQHPINFPFLLYWCTALLVSIWGTENSIAHCLVP